jgi:RNA polymerase sigma factor (sigma-70 family)
VNFSSLPYNSRFEEDSKLLLCKLKNADPAAWRHIYDCYYSHLLYFAFGLIQNEMEAEDIVQETICKLCRLIDRFDNVNNLRAFLYVTVRNNCFDYLRHRQHVLTAQKEILLNSDTVESPCQHFRHDATLVSALIRECIDQLPEQAQRIFKMYYYDGHSTAQIAFILGMIEQAVRNNKTRAISLLKEKLYSKLEGWYK